MIEIFPFDDEDIDIELYLINHHRLINARTNLGEVRAATRYYAMRDNDNALIDNLDEIEHYFHEMAREYSRLVMRDAS
jgi:hypothetical protein